MYHVFLVGKNISSGDTLPKTFTTKPDSISSKTNMKHHSPLKAALFSTALPGLWQGYNRKYWKIPIVYAGLGGLGYALYYTGSNFIGYRNAYRLEVDGNPATLGNFKGIDDEANLKVYRDYYKRNLDITAICTGIWYALNIVDAAVDAHLFEWNMKDDINVSWQPSLVKPGGFSNIAELGVAFTVRF